MGHIKTTVRTETLQGSFSKTIAVETNDPTQPKVSVVVHADVVESVNLLPSDRIVLRNALHSTPSAGILVRKDPTESGKLVIRDVETSVPWLLAGVREVKSPLPSAGDLPAGLPGDFVLEVHIEGAAVAGRSQQSVSFKTGLPRQPVVQVPVIVMFTPLVEIPLERLVLPAEAAEQTVQVFLRRGADPSLLRVEARPSTLKVELEPLGHRTFTLHVRWEGGPQADGMITFHLGEESHELPVEWAKNPQT